MNLYQKVAEIFTLIVQYCIIGMEAAGAVILVKTAVQSFYGYFRHKPHLRIELAEGISLALLFKMGGEVLRTVIVHDLNELLVLGVVVAIRGALTLLLHWEIRSEKAQRDAEIKKQS